MARFVVGAVFGIVVGTVFGAAAGLHAATAEDVQAPAAEAGVDPTELAGVVNTLQVDPRVYLRSEGLLERASSQQSLPPSAPSSPAAPTSGVWDRLVGCEASGNWHANTGNGFQGGLQFTVATWRAYGGVGSPAQASREVQIAVAERVLAGQGWRAWPACSRALGLR